jgi:hypothetical protein
MNLDYYIYAHTKPSGEIFYIGKGRTKRAWSKQDRNPYWFNVVNKYGYEVVLLAVNLTEQKALAEEQLVIHHFKKFGCLANLTSGGEGISGFKFSEQSKEKMKLAKIGAKHSAEHKLKNSLSNKGRVVPPEVRLRMSLARQNSLKVSRIVWWEGVEYKSIKALAEHLGVKHKTMCERVRRCPERYRK